MGMSRIMYGPTSAKGGFGPSETQIRAPNREFQMEECPVCKAEAEQFEGGFIDGYAVKCRTHGWFEFSDTVRATRENEPREAWGARTHQSSRASASDCTARDG